MTSLPSLPPDSSSPSPFPSLPFRSFSCLPTEIIQQIVESTSSSYYHPDTYIERQTTLRSLCLTSRLFFHLAKPYLYAVVRLTKRAQVKVFRDTEQDRAKVIETFELVLDGQGFKAESNDLYPLLAVSFSLRSIRLEGFATDVFALSRVEELNLYGDSSDVHIEEIVSPSTFPALRVLSLVNVDTREDLSTLLRNLEPQLDLIWMDEEDIEILAADVFDKINRKTLFHQHYRIYTPFPNVHSYRLLSSDAPEAELSTWEDLEEIVRTSTTPLPSVLYLAGCHTLDLHNPALKVPRQRFSDVCKARNMEVVYEAKPDWNGDFGRPKEFWRRMRGRKETSA